ncbi:MAG: DNA polymerase III subunit delta [Bacillota bacterium]
MDYQGLVNSLERKLVSTVYLLYGEETYLRDEVVNMFRDRLLPDEVREFNLDILDGRETAPDEIATLAATLPFMAEKRVVIVRDADFFKSRRKAKEESKDREKTAAKDEAQEEKSPAGEKALLEYLENPSASTCLVFSAGSVDKKKKLFKVIEKNGQVVEFSSLKGKELSLWLERRFASAGKKMEPAAAAELITAVGSNLQQLDGEAEKLISYTGQRTQIKKDDVAVLVGKTTELSIFELVDAVGERRYEKAVKMMRDMVTYGEPPIRILFMVARQFRLLLQVKVLHSTGYAEKQIASRLQLHPFVTGKCIRQSRNFQREELEQSLEDILAADVAIKTGRQEPLPAMEILLAHLCRAV